MSTNKSLMPSGFVRAGSETKFTSAGMPVANFWRAVKETYKNRDGVKETRTLWIRWLFGGDGGKWREEL